MATSTCERARGRQIAAATERELWGASAGYCERTECLKYLFHAADNGKVVTLGQLAHVVAASAAGPRADPEADDEALTAFDNLILLCPTCHYIVDQAEEDYPVDLLARWKRDRQARVRAAVRVVRYDDRSELRDELHRLLAFNAAIYKAYGPRSEAAQDPLSDAADTWRREAVERIVPNNRRIVELLDTNWHLLDDGERAVAADYRVHAEAFEARHLFGQLNSQAPTFPSAMSGLLKDGS